MSFSVTCAEYAALHSVCSFECVPRVSGAGLCGLGCCVCCCVGLLSCRLCGLFLVLCFPVFLCFAVSSVCSVFHCRVCVVCGVFNVLHTVLAVSCGVRSIF